MEAQSYRSWPAGGDGGTTVLLDGAPAISDQ
jgi:hypothetical protein